MSSIKEETIIFFTKFNFYLDRGWPILEVFKQIEEEMTCVELKEAIVQIHQDIAEGNYFYTSFEKFPTIFDQKVITFIQTGENLGLISWTFGKIPELIMREIWVV